MAEPAAPMRQFAQLFAQSTVIIAPRLVTDHRPIRRDDPARPPLADIKLGLKI